MARYLSILGMEGRGVAKIVYAELSRVTLERQLRVGYAVCPLGIPRPIRFSSNHGISRGLPNGSLPYS